MLQDYLHEIDGSDNWMSWFLESLKHQRIIFGHWRVFRRFRDNGHTWIRSPNRRRYYPEGREAAEDYTKSTTRVYSCEDCDCELNITLYPNSVGSLSDSLSASVWYNGHRRKGDYPTKTCYQYRMDKVLE